MILLVFNAPALAANSQESHRAELDAVHRDEPVKAISYSGADMGARSVQPTTAIAHDVYGFHPYWENGSEADYRWSALSTLIFFKLEVTFDGYLNTNNPNYAVPDGLVELAHANGVNVELAMTSTDTSANNALLTSKTYYTRAADALVAKVVAEGADGINVDLELIEGDNRDALTDFIKVLAQKMHAAKAGSTVSIDVPAIDWEDSFDMPALATHADALIVMGYDYWGGWSDTAGPIAPLYDTDWRANYSVADSIDTYLDEVAPDKLVLGVPWYGGSWETSGSSVPQSVNSNDWLGPLLFTEAEEEAALHNKNWYAPSRVPYTTAAAGQAFQTWYDDAQSLVEKYTFAEARDLAGVAVWALGYEDGNAAIWDGLTAYGQGIADSLTRVFGSNRYETAIAASQTLYPTADSAQAAVLATGQNWPDALGGAVLAKKVDGPLLLTATNDITPTTATELDRILVRGTPGSPKGTVYILGGLAAVSQEVENDLKGLGFNVVRYAGANRFATAATIATVVDGSPDKVFIGTGANFPDILSAAAPATQQAEPILLTNHDSLPQSTLDFLNGTFGDNIKTAYIVGGESVVSAGVSDALKARGLTVTRLAGTDRYDTSAKVAEHFYPHSGSANTSMVTLATGTTFADGLAGAVLAAHNDAPVLLVQPSDLPAPIWSYLEHRASAISSGFIFGGTAAISRAVQNVAQTLIAP